MTASKPLTQRQLMSRKAIVTLVPVVGDPITFTWDNVDSCVDVREVLVEQASNSGGHGGWIWPPSSAHAVQWAHVVSFTVNYEESTCQARSS